MIVSVKSSTQSFVCPESHTKLKLVEDNESSELFIENSKGYKFFIRNNIPCRLTEKDIEESSYAIELFKEKAAIYDEYQHLSFEIFYKSEEDVRNTLIDKLNLKSGYQVLEVNAGTGRDSLLISKRLDEKSCLHVQDISFDMLSICQQKLQNVLVPVVVTQSNAIRLPYPDDFFDAVYSFGGVGMNTYANNKDAFKELIRVSKPGASIVIGGLSLGPWLRNSLFGQILANHNKHYLNSVDLHHLPVEARDVTLSWILSGAGFVLTFSKGLGEPKANFDFQIPGIRGGTLRTRFYGQIEGVTDEAKRLLMKMAKEKGVSMHNLIDTIIKTEAKKNDIE